MTTNKRRRRTFDIARCGEEGCRLSLGILDRQELLGDIRVT